MTAPSINPRRSSSARYNASLVLLLSYWTAAANGAESGGRKDRCQIYIAESTIPNAGLGVFAGANFRPGEMIGRVGDAALPSVDQDWHNSAPGNSISRHSMDYHWPLTNYDWNAPDIGLDGEAEDISVTVTGFGAAPNCHFRLLNVEEHAATYDDAGLDRYTSPGAGASTPWFNRTSTANQWIHAGSELFVDYGPHWFLSRDEAFGLVPVQASFELAQAFLKQYGKLLVGSDNKRDLVPEKMALDDDAQRDLWDIVKTFPYPTRQRQALPANHQHAIKAINTDIRTIEKEAAQRPLIDLKEKGKCVDNIVPLPSNIPHAGRGAFATRPIKKGKLVAPAPLVHITDKSAADMYAEKIGSANNVIRDDERGVIGKQIIINYVFGHANSTLALFPYSSNVAYINHHSTEYNAELRWATDAPWIHHEEWLNQPVSFLEKQWSSGLMLEFIALRDIQPGEEVLINYGDEWQKAWDEHVKNWKPISPESDYGNLTVWTKPTATNNGKDGYVRADAFNTDFVTPLKTEGEQAEEPYPNSVQVMCKVNVNHKTPYPFEIEGTPFFTRNWDGGKDAGLDAEDDKHIHKCNITERYEQEDSSDDDEEQEGEEDSENGANDHKYLYTVVLDAQKATLDGGVVMERHEIEFVPRGAIEFTNVRYSSDIFLKTAFRHDMMLPDEIFPKAWMNRETTSKEGEK